MKKYPASAWRLPDGDSAYVACKECSMMVIKYREADNTAPRYAALEGRDDSGHYVGTLADGTRCRLDPKEVRVEWIKDFAG